MFDFKIFYLCPSLFHLILCSYLHILFPSFHHIQTLYKDVACTGIENTLYQCPHFLEYRAGDPDGCMLNHDAATVCTSKPPDSIYMYVHVPIYSDKIKYTYSFSYLYGVYKYMYMHIFVYIGSYILSSERKEWFSYLLVITFYMYMYMYAYCSSP